MLHHTLSCAGPNLFGCLAAICDCHEFAGARSAKIAADAKDLLPLGPTARVVILEILKVPSGGDVEIFRAFLSSVALQHAFLDGLEQQGWRACHWSPPAMRSSAAPTGEAGRPRVSRQNARRMVSRSAPCWRANETAMAQSRALVSAGEFDLGFWTKSSARRPSANRLNVQA